MCGHFRAVLGGVSGLCYGGGFPRWFALVVVVWICGGWAVWGFVCGGGFLQWVCCVTVWLAFVVLPVV